MLYYEWGNPSMIMLSCDHQENMQEFDPDRHHQGGSSSAFSGSAHTVKSLVDSYPFSRSEQPESLMNRTALYGGGGGTTAYAEGTTFPSNNNYLLFQHPHGQEESESSSLNNNNNNINSLYDPCASTASLLSLERAGVHHHHHQTGGYMLVPKAEQPGVAVGSGVGTEFPGQNRIGLNLGGRTYFSSAEDDFVNRLYRRSRAFQPGSVNPPRCQAEGCNADLTHAKHYHRRHKVCEFHSKAATVVAAGVTQRFCQQCSRFHQLSEFDNGKRSCRKRLADHNRRRRKTQQANYQENATKYHHDRNAFNNSSSESHARSPSDSGAHLSSVTVAVSPPRISLDCFSQRSFDHTASSSSASGSSMFFSTNNNDFWNKHEKMDY